MIVIINYELGNLGSIQNMLHKLGYQSLISNCPKEIEQATKLILPGVGAFDKGMENLHKTGLIPLLNYKVREEKTPILGICLGMQLLTRQSEEGERKQLGLGWIEANTVRFQFGERTTLRIPHMGWNFVEFTANHPLGNNLPEDPRFYFVHSYHPICDDPSDSFINAVYGYNFVAGIHNKNIFGVQFHPEKSHKYGMQLLHNFAEMVKPHA